MNYKFKIHRSYLFLIVLFGLAIVALALSISATISLSQPHAVALASLSTPASAVKPVVPAPNNSTQPLSIVPLTVYFLDGVWSICLIVAGFLLYKFRPAKTS